MPGVIGWLGDFFRLWWALLYWNIRKRHSRLRRLGTRSSPLPRITGFRKDGDGLFVRVSSNRPRAAIASEPLLVQILSRLKL